MENIDYEKFITLKDLLYKVSQQGKLTNECRELRDKLVVKLGAILYADLTEDWAKENKQGVRQ